MKWRDLVADDCWGPRLTHADRDALEGYCILYARMLLAEENVRAHGEVVASPNGFPCQSPWLSIANACRKDMGRIQAEFGGVPSARIRLGTPEPPRSDDVAERFFGGP